MRLRIPRSAPPPLLWLLLLVLSAGASRADDWQNNHACDSFGPDAFASVYVGWETGHSINDGCQVPVTVPRGSKVALLRFRAAWRLSTGVDCNQDLGSLPAGINLCSHAYSVQVLAANGETLYDSQQDTGNQVGAGPAGWTCPAGYRCLYSTERPLIAIPLGNRADQAETTLTLAVRFTGMEANTGLFGTINAHQLIAHLHGAPQLELTRSRVDFRPRDSREPAVAQCAAFPDHCRPAFTARLQIDGGWDELWNNGWEAWGGPAYGTAPLTPLQARLRFTLRSPSSLRGTSTNFGTDLGLDYRLEQQPGFRPANFALNSLETNNLVSQAQVRLTSVDYGGTAYLEASAEFPGASLPVTRLLAAETLTPAVPPTCDGGRLRAQLPLDADCDGIADQWEQQYGGNLDPAADQDQGFTVASPRGDGFSVHDEYRGFHHLGSDGKSTWTSTNPEREQDLFYWDASNILGDAVDRIFARVVPHIKMRKVNREQANGRARMNEESALRRFNQNSIHSLNQFALWYLKRSLGSGELGKAGYEPKYGFVNDGYPILINSALIDSYASSVSGRDGTMPSATLLAQVVAHETGHKLSRSHSTHGVVVQPWDESGLASLGIDQAMVHPTEARTFFFRYGLYRFNGLRKEDIFYAEGYSLTDCQEASLTLSPEPPSGTYRVRCGAVVGTPRPLPSRLILQNQVRKLMDWTPRLTLTTDAAWDFLSSDKEKLCVKSSGCN